MASPESLLAQAEAAVTEHSVSRSRGLSDAPLQRSGGGTAARPKRGSNVRVGEDGAVRFRGETDDGLMEWDGRPFDLVGSLNSHMPRHCQIV